MMTQFAIAFPGQGSQAVGMLAELAEQHAIIKETWAKPGRHSQPC
jgi:[acyl-carrier-protein] S-malonyltransferase